MKANIYENYGLPNVLELKVIEKLSPNIDEFLITALAVSILTRGKLGSEKRSEL